MPTFSSAIVKMPEAPKPKRRRLGNGTWREPFLAALRNSGNVRAACMAAKVSRTVVYRRREDDEPFRLLWDEASHEALELLEAEARRRAMSGSDTLLIFLLKAHDAKYRFAENSRLELPGDSQAVKGFELRVVYDTPWAPPSDGEEPDDE